MHRASATSHFLKQSSPEDMANAAQAKVQAKSEYYENMLLGSIDGLTSGFNDDCRGGLAETVRSFFDVLNNIEIYKPDQVAKFNLANVNLVEATNVVYAMCDITSLTDQLTTLADFDDPTQYIVVGSRIGGSLIGEFPTYRACIQEGKERENGYDVGYCSTSLASILLDTSL